FSARGVYTWRQSGFADDRLHQLAIVPAAEDHLLLGIGELAIAVALAEAERAFVTLAVADRFDGGSVERVTVPVAGLHDRRIGLEQAAHARSFELARCERALVADSARTLHHAGTGRLAVAPLALVDGAIGGAVGAAAAHQ